MIMPHRCDESCTCPVHGTPLTYHPASGDHACQDASCVHGHGALVSGCDWAGEFRYDRQCSFYAEHCRHDGHADHFWCDDCPCACGHPEPYEAQCGTKCWNCHGIIERKFIHRLVAVSPAGGITVYRSEWEPV